MMMSFVFKMPTPDFCIFAVYITSSITKELLDRSQSIITKEQKNYFGTGQSNCFL